jgi:hypothetical protein
MDLANSESGRRILEQAIRAPSIDNTQPFSFQWRPGSLAVYHDGDLDRKRGNEGGLASLVALGCLVEYVAIAASGEGLAATVRLAYRPGDDGRPWAEIAFQPSSNPPDGLLPALAIRHSDRRPYQGGDPAAPIFGELQEEAAGMAGPRLYWQPDPGPELIDYLLGTNDLLWKDERLLPEMFSWVRWSRRQVLRTRDGMPWPALGVNFLVSRLMMMIAKSALFRGLVKRAGLPQRAGRESLLAQVRSSAALGLITVPAAEPGYLMDTGRAFVRAWLGLNPAGYGFQVLALPVIGALQAEIGLLPADYPESIKRRFAGGAAVLREAFAVPSGELPAWLFRTGLSAPTPEDHRTLRRPLERFLVASG